MLIGYNISEDLWEQENMQYSIAIDDYIETPFGYGGTVTRVFVDSRGLAVAAKVSGNGGTDYIQMNDVTLWEQYGNCRITKTGKADRHLK